jgi:hypothetical protein
MKKLRLALITFWFVLTDRNYYFYSKDLSLGNITREESFEVRGELIDMWEDKKEPGIRLKHSRETFPALKQAA